MKGRIVLDSTESSIFRLLVECVESEQLAVTLRVAGGWVRDKLLGLSSHDIDIAVDRMMGRTFVDRLQEFMLQKRGGEEGGQGMAVRGVGTIKCNPVKSKHLETATMVLCGVSVDFVNLRSESYAQDMYIHEGRGDSSMSVDSSSSSGSSRIPVKVGFGTPLEDAQRRDITINSLFYNLHSGLVEDHCGVGLSDLERGLIRTPLNPLITLLDDPLRLLRVIRFAARFNYTIADELLHALHNQLVHRAFRGKVSRERVGIEIDKMLSNQASVQVGMRYLLHEQMYPLIFLQPPQVDCELLLDIYHRLVAGSGFDARLAAYCTLFIPLATRPQPSAKDSPCLAALRDGLKLPGRECVLVSRIVDGLLLVMDADTTDPVSVGRTIMSIGAHWRLSVVLARAFGALTRVRFDHLPFTEAASKFRLQDCFSMAPLINGDDIKTCLGVQEGQRVGALLRQAVDTQLSHPDLTKQDLMEQLRRSVYLESKTDLSQ